MATTQKVPTALLISFKWSEDENCNQCEYTEIIRKVLEEHEREEYKELRQHAFDDDYDMELADSIEYWCRYALTGRGNLDQTWVELFDDEPYEWIIKVKNEERISSIRPLAAKNLKTTVKQLIKCKNPEISQETPKALALKKAIVNIKNTDQECFKWSVLASQVIADRDANRLSKYKNLNTADYDLDFSMVSYPTTLNDIIKFEKANNISINVFGCNIYKRKENDVMVEKASPYIIQKSNVGTQPRQVDLVMLTKNGSNHFCWIKNFSRFCGNPTRHNNGGKSHFCHYCLQGFATAEKLQQHVDNGSHNTNTLSLI
eukprot:SAG31_NODE_354_length_17223_cov_18.708771_5_plen_316_part_00